MMASRAVGLPQRPRQLRLSIICVTYNSSAVLARMLRDLTKISQIELVVVDNASVDHSVDVVRSTMPGATVIQNSENLGFARAVNIGVENSSASTILLLNPDAYIDAHSIWTCVGRLETRPDVGIVAPLLEHPAGRLKVLEAGREPTLGRMILHYSGLSRLARFLPSLEGIYLLASGTPSSARQVDWVSGACLFISRSCWTQVGGLSERWFMYAEDTDMCLRVKDAGWRVELLPDARAVHGLGASAENADASAIVNSAWILNLYDLYKSRYRPRPVTAYIWKVVAGLGLRQRAWLYRIRHVRRPVGGGVDWLSEAKRFDAYAHDILAAPSGQAKEKRSDDNW